MYILNIFYCNDGCCISGSYLSDNWCDYLDCKDKITTYWDCGNCNSAGCPTTCGGFTECDGIGPMRQQDFIALY